MVLAAGVISQVSVGSNVASLAVTAAHGGTGPYTNQWYRSTTTGFSPGGGNIITGATGLTLNDTGLIPNTVYYYKVVQTDTGHSNDEVTATQLAVTTSAPSQSQNQFTQSPYLGMLDLRFNADTVAVQIDATQATALFTGSPVKVVDSAGGVPKVVACTAHDDVVFGFIVYDMKSISFSAGDMAEVSLSGNVMYLYATTAISRIEQVTLDVANNGVAAANSGDTLVGWAYDKATAPGQLIRVYVTTPGFTTAD